MYEESADGYRTGLVCLNGHVLNGDVKSQPDFNVPFCSECGAGTTVCCDKCKAVIRGSYQSDRVSAGFYKAPSFCYQCGGAYPWTERRIQAAIDLTIDELEGGEKKVFAEDIKSISADTPQSIVSAKRLKKLLGKLPTETATALKAVLVGLATEAVKRNLWP